MAKRLVRSWRVVTFFFVLAQCAGRVARCGSRRLALADQRASHEPQTPVARDDLRQRAKSLANSGLVLNLRGFERFVRSGLDTAAVITSCTEAHSRVR